jgi:hypothetical protein
MKMAILELEYKNIRKITALKLPFTKADGSVISNNFIMMANGTGKTTTMELIKGLFDGTAAGWTASKVRSFAPTLTEADTGEFSICKVIHDQENAEKLIHTFWNHVVVNMREWNEMDSGELSKKSLREDYITTQGLIILALGRLGEFYCVNPQINMAKSLKGLKKIDWLRNNEACWMNRAIKPNGKINRNEQGIFLTYIQIKRLLSLPVSDEETKKERIIMG